VAHRGGDRQAPRKTAQPDSARRARLTSAPSKGSTRPILPVPARTRAKNRLPGAIPLKDSQGLGSGLGSGSGKTLPGSRSVTRGRFRALLSREP
jgi:hypothetical protein